MGNAAKNECLHSYRHWDGSELLRYFALCYFFLAPMEPVMEKFALHLKKSPRGRDHAFISDSLECNNLEKTSQKSIWASLLCFHLHVKRRRAILKKFSAKSSTQIERMIKHLHFQ